MWSDDDDDFWLKEEGKKDGTMMEWIFLKWEMIRIKSAFGCRQFKVEKCFSVIASELLYLSCSVVDEHIDASECGELGIPDTGEILI